jgi:hypothetical protein
MKTTLKGLLITLLICCLPQLSKAQTEEESIKSAVYNYLDGITKGDTSLLNKAFHPSAILRTVNNSTGKIQDFPVKTFISKTPVGGVKATTKLLSYSFAGISAQASAELSFEDFKYIDLLSLLKVNNEWKIVCRVFSRVELGINMKSISTNSNASKANSNNNTSWDSPKKTVAPASKAKKDDGW